MDPGTALGVAINIARVIIHLTYTYKLQQTHIGILCDRIISIEKPLETLERASKAGKNTISEAALTKLISTLKEVQKLINFHQKDDKTSKTKRFFFGDANMDDLKLIRERLDSSLLDLQLAITVEEADNSEKRVDLTARATVVNQRNTETILKCVQCDAEYRQSENAIGSCKYHTAQPVYTSWKYHLACCGAEVRDDEGALIGNPDCPGCTRGVHCDFQHTQYPYTAYYKWMEKQKNSNVKETWLRVADLDFEDGYEKHVSFGISNDNLLFVAMGKDTTTAVGNMLTIAMRGSDNQPGVLDESTTTQKWIVDALWILNDKKEITGIRLSASSLSSKFPVVQEIYFTLTPLVRGPVRVLSVSNAPRKFLYSEPLPVCETKLKPFPDSVFQEPPLEPTFETVVKGNMQVRLKKSSKCDVNIERSNHQADTFYLEFYIMNLSQGATLGSSTEERMIVLNMLKDGKMAVDEAIKLLSTLDSSPHQHGSLTFIDCRARFFFEGKWIDPIYTKVTLKKEDKKIDALPFELAPRGATLVTVETQVPCPEKKNASQSWFHRGYICRLSPINIEITFEEMSGQTCSIMSQYANRTTKFNPKPETALYYLHADDTDLWERYYIAALPPDLANYPECVCTISVNSSRTLAPTFRDLLRWGYSASKNSEAVFEIKDYTDSTATIHGLVDLMSNIVVGFKFHINCGSSFAEGTWMIPEDLIHASRRVTLGEEIEKALWLTTPSTPPPAEREGEVWMGANAPPKRPARTFLSRGSTDATAHVPPAHPPPPTPTSSSTSSTSSSSSTSTSSTSSPATTTTPTIPRQPSNNSIASSSSSSSNSPRPAPPPRTYSSSSSLATASTSSPSTTSSSPSASPSASPSLTSSSSSTNLSTTSTSSPSTASVAAVTAMLTPAPLSPAPAPSSPASTPKIDPEKIAHKCQTCSFANKKNECIKCKAIVPTVPVPPPGLVCVPCRMPMKNKCFTCNGMMMVNKTPSVMCGKCAFAQGKDKCVKCSKIVV